jgi:hypothetical protein
VQNLLQEKKMMVWSSLAYSSLFLMTKKLVKKEGAGTAAMEGGAKGLVAAGALAAAIGGIYLFSHRPSKVPKNAKSWILRAKADVMEEIQKIPHVSRKAYLGTVRSVLKHYASLKDASKDELSGLRKDLENQWEMVVKNLKKA